jgi:hypothetical protein
MSDIGMMARAKRLRHCAVSNDLILACRFHGSLCRSNSVAGQCCRRRALCHRFFSPPATAVACVFLPLFVLAVGAAPVTKRYLSPKAFKSSTA